MKRYSISFIIREVKSPLRKSLSHISFEPGIHPSRNISCTYTPCSRMNGGPPPKYVHPEPVEVVLFGKKRNFANVIKVRMLRWDLEFVGWALSLMISVLIRGSWTQTGRQCEAGGGDRSAASTSQGTPRVGRSRQKAGERPRTDLPAQSLAGTDPAHTWISDSWPSELWGNAFLLF